MIVLSRWTARRVGPGITIEGVDSTTDRPLKVTNVGAIRSGDPDPVASGYVKGLSGEQPITLKP